MRLSQNFTLQEFSCSDVAQRYGIDNTVPAEAIENIQYLVDNLLQPLRDRYGKPIRINSGYRCMAHNRHPQVNGSTFSQHMTGEAADIAPVDSADLERLTHMIANGGFTFDQLIIYKTFIHVSLRRKGNRQRILRM